MGTAWENWSGVVRFEPALVERPEDEAEIVALVLRARDEGRTLRPVGSGHSWSPLVETDETLVSLDRWHGLVSHDAVENEATLRAGTVLREGTEQLFAAGLAFENLGDIDEQQIGGAISTGTHGSGKDLESLSGQVAGLRIVNGSGQIVEASLEEHEDLLRAAQLSLGALGIITEVRLRVMPSTRTHMRRWCMATEDALEQMHRLAEEHRSFDFYWYPRRDEVRARTIDLTDLEPEDLPDDVPRATEVPDGVGEEIGWSGDLIPSRRELRFNEMEYALPAEAAADCFREVRRRMLERHRREVAWRVFVRSTGPEEAWLSAEYQRETFTISLLQNARLPFREFFDDIEPILKAHEGRPHWGKIHSCSPDELRERLPMFDRFLDMRRRMDPDGVFLNPYLRDLLGVA